MSGIFPAFDKDVPGVDANSVGGKGISKNLDALDKIADILKCDRLSTLIDGRTLFEQVCEDEGPVPDYVPPVLWYDAPAKITDIQNILAYVKAQPETLPDAEWAVFDLEALAATLQAAREVSARFHLLVDL